MRNVASNVYRWVFVASWALIGFSFAKAEDSSFLPVSTILSKKCLHCHSGISRKGGLDLSTREGMLQGGDSGAALVPSEPEHSTIYVRSIPQNGARPEMPAKGEALSVEEAQTLRDWILGGAIWNEGVTLHPTSRADASFWSFQPLASHDPPAVSDAPKAWQSSPIDRFIYAKLGENGLSPNANAQASDLIRRISYDLIGLPPTPEEIENFISAYELNADQAVATLVDRLLESPHYGERWGRHWLDVVRFGESRGYERNEIIRNLWPFRDYVIRSLNQDKPIDQFIVEHLAGDVLAPDDPETLIGSAFLVAGPYDDVGNQDPIAAAQIRADQMDEMIRATSEAFLGLTLGCARCHDHKFDPLLQRDYYGFYATFAGVTHGEREVASPTMRTERESRVKPLEEQLRPWTTELESLEKTIADRIKANAESHVAEWTRERASRYETVETFPSVEVKFVRLVTDGTDSTDPNRRSYQLDEFEVWSDDAAAINVALSTHGGVARGDSNRPRDFTGAYEASLVNDGIYGARWISTGAPLVIELAKPTRINRVVFSSDRNRALPEDSPVSVFLGDYRLEVSIDGESWSEVANSNNRAPINETRRTVRLRKVIVAAEEQSRMDTLKSEIARIRAEIERVPALPVWWVGKRAEAPGPFAIFLGGNPQKKGEEAFPTSLSAFDHTTKSFRLEPASSEGDRRLALAKWLVSSEQPLTARVWANRIWKYHFGTGMVDTPSDFGFMGSRPSHPELLDWLAQEVKRNGWRLKPMHRLIMNSQAYRQSADWRMDAARLDSDARLLWRFPPRRLEAEEIRDTILEVAGKLDRTQGGPGFKLYEYLQDNVATYVPLEIHGPETYRRSIYHHNARAAPVDLVSDFDCPDPAFAEPRRPVTTTPLQALSLMNHRFTLDMATAFAERLDREASTTETKIRRAFLLAFGRQPSHEEIADATALMEAHGARAFGRAIFNASELIHIR